MMKFRQRNICPGCGKRWIAAVLRLWLVGIVDAAKENL
jgi:hypothetical protein